jgi:D-3-phosphoglycerate dehydrogenase / 2-oxoglutarate reductase
MAAKPNLLINLPPTFFTVPWLKPHLARLDKLGTVRTSSHNTPEEMAADLAWARNVVMWSWPVFDEAMLDKAGGLDYLGQINTTGTTAKACLKMKIALSEARHCWSPAVAEMALTLILAGLRRTSEFHAQMRTGAEPWVGDFPADIDQRERQLTGRSVGIVGFGGIGRRLAELLRPFETDLRIYDPFVAASAARPYGARPTSLKDLVKSSEVIVLCAANTDGAKHLLNAELVNALKPGTLLVNVGRSMLVDMAALAQRLRKDDMVAMLDVFDKEPLEKDSVLRTLPNAFLTPHRAGGIAESVQRALTMLTDDLDARMKGRKRKYAVTAKMLACFPG